MPFGAAALSWKAKSGRDDMSGSKIVGAVEIGASKITVLVGEIVEDESLNIVAHSTGSSRGVKKGRIIDLEAAGNAVHAAIWAAEKNAGARIDEVYLAQTGRHLQATFNIGAAHVESPDNVVREDDLERAREDAKRRKLPEGRTYLHHIRNPYWLDGEPSEHPLSRRASQVQVGYWSVHADSRAVEDALRLVSGIDLPVADMIVSSIASASVLLDDAEKEGGALVIDIGGGASDYALFRDGYIVRTGVVAVGGDHLTNDLSIGLRMSRANAEHLKLKEGRACFESDDKETKAWLFGDLTIGDSEYPLSAITRILDARVNEIFRIVREALGEAFEPGALAGGVVVTGGTARLSQIDRMAERVFETSARVGVCAADVDEELRQPEYSTTLGLLHYALMGQEEANAQASKQRGLWRRVANLLNFG